MALDFRMKIAVFLVYPQHFSISPTLDGQCFSVVYSSVFDDSFSIEHISTVKSAWRRAFQLNLLNLYRTVEVSHLFFVVLLTYPLRNLA